MSGSSCLLLTLLAGKAAALPVYQRLFKVRYDYRPNCTLCHDRDSWDLTLYGKDYHNAGRGLDGFGAIEKKDSDRDGTPNGLELRSRANAGSLRSTVEKPLDWLESIPQTPIPRKHLRALFPSSDAYAHKEGFLEAGARQRVEAGLGRGLRLEDLYPVYFEAYKNGRLVGLALYGTSEGGSFCAFLAGYAPDGAVKGLRVLSAGERALRKGDYLRQFEGTDLHAVRPPAPALREASDALVLSVQTGSAIVRELSR